MVAASATQCHPATSQRSSSPVGGGIDADEFEHSICLHAARWHAVAKRMLRSDDKAADAVQEAYLAALSSRNRFRGESLPSTWMHRIVVNVCLMRLRTERRQTLGSIDSLPMVADCERRSGSSASRPELACQQQELRDQVRNCIDQLPPDHRAILLLRDIEQLDTGATAQTLAISRAAVKTRLHRARQALRALLQHDADEYCLPA
jgi:RNA polymerase sigma-70 factor (ECF subfamily)